jgi:hypothetical protein
MTIESRNFACATLLGCLLAIPAMQRAESQAPPQPPERAAEPQNPEETAEEKEKKKKKKKQQQQQEVEERQRQQQTPEERQQDELRRQQQQQQEERQQQPERRPPPEQQRRAQPQDQQQQERQVALQKQQERELQQKRAQQERQQQQKRVSRQQQQERIRKQEQQLALYRKNIALREQLAERDAEILRQQRRIQHLRFHQQYEERLRAQQAQLVRARYDFYNDPFYYTAPNYRYRRDGRYYFTNQYGIRQLERALQAGYNEGFKAGRADRADRWRYDYRSAFAYRDANYGYEGRYLDQDEYHHYFREGFQRGYDDGYYGRRNYGRQNDDGGINDEWLIAGAVVAAIIGYELLTG